MPLPTSLVVKNGSKIRRLHLLRDAGPVVVDLENHGVTIGVVPGADDERAAAVRAEHGLLRVDDQVQQHLLNLVRIRKHFRQSRGERLENVDVADALFVRAKRQRLANHLIQVHHRARGVTLAGEGQQIADDLGRALRLTQDRFEAALGLIVDRSLREPLGPRQDRGERIVELVGDAGDRLPQRRQLLRLQQLMIQIARLILEPLALADVAHQRLDADAVGRRFRVCRDFHPDRRTVGPAQAEQVIGNRAVALKPLDEPIACLGIDEAFELERPNLFLRCLRRIAEHQFEKGIGRECERGGASESVPM